MSAVQLIVAAAQLGRLPTASHAVPAVPCFAMSQPGRVQAAATGNLSAPIAAAAWLAVCKRSCSM